MRLVVVVLIAMCVGVLVGAASSPVILALLPSRAGNAVASIVDRAFSDHTTRRVVTGHDPAGKSVVISDGSPPVIDRMGDLTFVEVWRTRSFPVPLGAAEATEPTLGPLTLAQSGGSVFRLVDYLPARLGGQRTEMHRTSTIDYCIVLQGEIVLVLDGSEVTLKTGDIVIQRGTYHAWENRGDKLARVAFVMLDASFTDDLRKKIPQMKITN